jgi:hypothetical protein
VQDWSEVVQCPECLTYLRHDLQPGDSAYEHLIGPHMCLLGGQEVEVKSVWSVEPLRICLGLVEQGGPIAPPSHLAFQLIPLDFGVPDVTDGPEEPF